MQPISLKNMWRPLAITAAFAFLAITFQRSARSLGSLPAPDSQWLLLAGFLFLLHYVVQAVGWHLILRALGARVECRASVRMWYASIIARWIPGRVWYSATRLYMAGKEGISVPAVTVAMVLELMYILVGGVLAAVAFAGSLMTGVRSSELRTTTLAVAIAAVVACGTVIVRPHTLQWMWNRVSLFRRAVKRLTGREILEEDLPTVSVASSLALLAYYTAFWVFSGVMCGVLARAFMPMNPTRWLACIPAFSGSWLMGFFSLVTPAGIGAREGSMVLLLRPVMSVPSAVVLALASRIAMLGTEVISVSVAYMVLRERSLPAQAAAIGEESYSLGLPLSIPFDAPYHRRWTRYR